MKTKRILHVCHLKGSGIGTVVMNLFRNINREKFMFDFWVEGVDSQKEFFEDEATDLGARIYKYSTSSNIFRKHYLRLISLYNTIIQQGYDIVHIHASDSICIEYAVVARVAGVRRIYVHSHNSYIPNDEKNSSAKILVHNIIKPLWRIFADYYIAVSYDAAKWMFSKKIMKSDKFFLLKNGIDVNKYLYNPDKRDFWRSILHINDDTFVIGNVGRLVNQKNPVFLIEILKAITKIKHNTVLLLVGRDGTNRAAMEDKINKYGLNDKVVFYGEAKNVEDLLQTMDFFVFPSIFEGLGVVAVEAQASGLPVIASTGVPKDARAGSNFYQEDLSKGADFWAKRIIDIYCGFVRKDCSLEIKEFGYDIVECSKSLEKIYSM